MVGVQDLVVKQTAPDVFEVSIGGRSPTRHRVTASPQYVRLLAGDRAPAAELVRQSFEFLLEREPNTGILAAFDLKVIQTYFPEYEQAMTAAFAE
jgi:hypothetical protein